MRTAKNILFTTTIALSFNVIASSCLYENIDGDEFTFTKPSPLDVYRSPEYYQHWYANVNSPSKLSYSNYIGKKGKLSYKYTTEFNIDHGSNNLVSAMRAYPATLENCEKVYLMVDEKDKHLSKYLDIKNFANNGHPKFKNEESFFNIRFDDNYNLISSHIGKTIVILPQSSGQNISYRLKDDVVYGEIPSGTELILSGVENQPFVKNGLQESPYRLISTLNGEVIYIPWKPMYVHLGNHSQKLNVRDKYLQDVISGNIRYGMNIYEVQAAWGVPDYIKRNVVFMNGFYGEDINYDFYADYDERLKLLMNSAMPHGIESNFYYNEKIGAGKYLVFDKLGILKEHNQLSMPIDNFEKIILK